MTNPLSRPARVPATADAEDARASARERPPAPAADPDATCWCCAGPTVKRHCKIICTNCGFMRDCSDP